MNIHEILPGDLIKLYHDSRTWIVSGFGATDHPSHVKVSLIDIYGDYYCHVDDSDATPFTFKQE